MLNWWVRYSHVLREAELAPGDLVLDVGSGRYGLSWYHSGQVVQTDLRFAPVPDDDADRLGRASFVSSSVELLPFADRSFDVVVCSDVLEHVPARARRPAMAELQRVARRRVVLCHPVGPPARATDLALRSLLRLLRRPQPDWLDQHLDEEGYPDAHLVAHEVASGWTLRPTRRSGNVVLLVIVVLGELVGRGRRWLSALERRWIPTGVPAWFDLPPAYRTVYRLDRTAR